MAAFAALHGNPAVDICPYRAAAIFMIDEWRRQ
jgi:hypothetical protein